MEIVIASIVGILLGAFCMFAFKRLKEQSTKKTANSEAQKIMSKAQSEAARLKKDSEMKAKDFETKARRTAETEINKQKAQLKNKESQLEKRLKEVEDQHKHRSDDNEKFAQGLKDRQEKIQISENRLKDLEKSTHDQIKFLQTKLENVAGMSQDQAKRELFMVMEDAAKKDASVRISQIEEETIKEADKRSKAVIARALARFASEYTSERTVSVMSLTSDEMKGKIIGREGRNIRTLEALCGDRKSVV